MKTSNNIGEIELNNADIMVEKFESGLIPEKMSTLRLDENIKNNSATMVNLF